MPIMSDESERTLSGAGKKFDMFVKVLVLLLTAVVSGAARPSYAAVNETPSPERLKEAVQHLMNSPHDAGSLQTMLAYSRSAAAVPGIKSRTMAIYAWSALAKGDTNLFSRARESHAAHFPADKHFITIQLAACSDSCPKCAGTGFTESVNACASCEGARICLACKGTGRWQILTTYDSRVHGRQEASNMTCKPCGGNGRCGTCGGVTTKRAKCDGCNGAGTLFEIPAAKITTATKSLLGDILSSLEADERLASRIRSAQAETNIVLRINLLASLKRDLQDRPEVQDIERLLFADQQQLAALRAAEQEKEQTVLRELSALRALKDPANPKAALATLSEYLASHPESQHKIEIQSLIDGVKAKLVRQQEHKRLAYWIGGLLVVLMALSCVNISFHRYTVVPATAENRRPRPPVK